MKKSYQKICEKILKNLAPRTFDVIKRRFGLENGRRETLESIGREHNLTRERIRQIEKNGIDQIKPAIEKYGYIFKEIKEELKLAGGLREEKSFLDNLAKNGDKNCLNFLLIASGKFKKFPEDEEFYSFWSLDKKYFLLAKGVIKEAISFLKKEKKLFEAESLFSLLKKAFPGKINKFIFQSYIGISKRIEKNPEGLYGLSDWIEIRPRGIKDKAYLVLKKKEKPLHFKEIASQIGEMPFSHPKGVQTATVHNELIKDKRFVLVGRGLYALKEWGYEPGTVKDVILKILKQSGKPLKKEEISEMVLKERIVKKNTIFLSLSDKNYFLRDDDGGYRVNEA